MAKLEVNISLNIKPVIQAIRRAEENIFIYLSEFDSMESDLNCLGIETQLDSDGTD